MKILVTGGAGFIGAHVTRALQERGEEVTVLDDFNAYYDPALKRARVAGLLKAQTSQVELDLTDAAATHTAVQQARPDAVIHLAAWAGVRASRDIPHIVAAANILGTVNVFEACKRAHVPRVLFASSSSVYGADSVVPTPEEAAGSRQRSAYGASKRAGELYASLYHGLEGLQVTCLRFFTVYGAWGRPDMSYWRFAEALQQGRPLLLYRRSADGREVRRAFTDIRDIVRGTLAALDRPQPFAIVNLGSEDQVPLARYVAVLEKAFGKRARIREAVLPEDQEVQTGADLRRARELLGYAPSIRIEEGIPRFVEWYRGELRTLFPNGLAPSRFWS